MQICRLEDAPVNGGRSFAPSRGLLARLTQGRGGWFLRCTDDLLAVQLGVRRPGRGSRESAPVILIEPGEIAVVRKESELLALPDDAGSFERAPMVYIDLHLRHSRTDDIAKLLAAQSPEDQAVENVRVLQPGTVRLIWQGARHRMEPDVDEAVALIRAAAGAAPEARARTRSWDELGDEEFGDYVLRLQDAGDYAEAQRILQLRDERDGQSAGEYVRRPDASA